MYENKNLKRDASDGEEPILIQKHGYLTINYGK